MKKIKIFENDESKIDSDKIVNDFLQEQNKLSKSIKNMSINSRTETILFKLHDMAKEQGYLTEQGVFGVLSQEEKNELKKYRVNEDFNENYVDDQIDKIIEPETEYGYSVVLHNGSDVTKTNFMKINKNQLLAIAKIIANPNI